METIQGKTFEALTINYDNKVPQKRDVCI